MRKTIAIVLLGMVIGFIPDHGFTADWSAMTSGTANNLNGVWGRSGSDVFAVGDNGTILYYDGTSWTAMTNLATNNLNGVWGSAGSNVYTVGDNGTILRYDGTAWSAMTSPTTNNLNSIGGDLDGPEFAVGDNGTIISYNGSWKRDTGGEGITTNQLNSVWIYSNYFDFAYFVGNNGTLLSSDDSWTSPMPPGTFTGNLNAIWGLSVGIISIDADFYFVVGDAGTIAHFGGLPPDGFMDSGTTENLYDVWGSTGTDVFAVGANGTILHYTPTVCVSVNPRSGSKWQTLDVTITGANSHFRDEDSTV